LKEFETAIKMAQDIGVSFTVTDLYPHNEPLWTGTVSDSSFTDSCQMRAVEYEFGFAKFDISEIPDGSYIWSVTIHLYVIDTYWPYWCITKESFDPLTTDAGTIWSDIYNNYSNGNVYSWNYENSSYGPGWHSYDFSMIGENDFQDALSQGWFCVGALDFDFGTTYYVIFDGWCGNSPYITVEYDVTPPPIPMPCYVIGYCGPFPADFWLADLAYDPTRGLLYQVEVDSAGSDILIFEAYTCDYCEAYDDVTGVSQRGIAYDPGEDVIYVGGWNSMGVYKFSTPSCGDYLSEHYLDFCDLSSTNFWDVSGLAWDDIDGGIYMVNSSDNQLGKLDFSSCEILWYGDIVWMWISDYTAPSAAGLGFSPEFHCLAGVVFDNDSLPKSRVEIFIRPEDDPFDPYAADTFCYFSDDIFVWGLAMTPPGFLSLDSYLSEVPTFYDLYTQVWEIPDEVRGRTREFSKERLTVQPNPFTETAEISFLLPKEGDVSLSLYDVSGRLVKRILSGRLGPGSHSLVLHGGDLPSGVYFVKLKYGKRNITKKLLLVK
jgi:hypothetical protein